MGRNWSMRCPYCKAEFAYGWGYEDTFPVIWVPFIRCYICGKLSLIPSNEFLTIQPEKRLKFKNNQKICQLIEQSLDRTNNQEYVKILIDKGIHIYPVNDNDRNKFTHVNFDKYENCPPSKEATQLLYDVRILIEEDKLDKITGTYKKKILEERQKNYNINKKAAGWGSIAGLIVGIVSCSIIANNSPPDSYLFMLGIVIGFFAFFVTFMGVSFLLNYGKIKKSSHNNSTNEITKKAEYSSKEKNIVYLKRLYKNGIITEEEYKQKINKILDEIN